jgi:NADPH2:quinone reductase
MKALVCEEFGPPEMLRFADVVLPEPALGEVRIAVHRVAVNFPDLLMVGGKYQLKPPFPFTPGIEVSGVVDAVGAGVTGFSPNERVMARLDLGGFAEAVCVATSRLVRMPDEMTFDHGAGFLVGYGTTYHALVERAGLRVGEVLLVLGATGGVGLTAVELGKRMGAIVIAAGGSDEKLAVAREYGADFVINYRNENIRDRVKAITGGDGADVVYDPVGGDATDQAVRSLAWGGRLLVIGFSSGSIADIPANRCLIKGASAVGVLWGLHAERNPDAASEAYRRLANMYRRGMLKPKVSKVVPFAQARSAIAALSDRSVVGRIVVSVRD